MLFRKPDNRTRDDNGKDANGKTLSFKVRAQDHTEMLEAALARPGVREIMKVYGGWQEREQVLDVYRSADKEARTDLDHRLFARPLTKPDTEFSGCEFGARFQLISPTLNKTGIRRTLTAFGKNISPK